MEGGSNSNEELTRNLKEYIDLSIQTQETKKELKIIAERKKELEEAILVFMEANSIDVLRTQGGSIKLYDAKSKAPLNEEYLRETLGETLDSATLDSIIETAFKQRPVTNTRKIKLGIAKKSD